MGKNLAPSRGEKGPLPLTGRESIRGQRGGGGTGEAGWAISSSFSAYSKSEMELSALD